MSGKHLVLVGGGHAHLTLLAGLRAFSGQGHRVTLINPSPYHYYSGMGPGMLSGIYEPEEIRFPVAEMAIEGGGFFVEDRVRRIDPHRKVLQMERHGEIAYDAVSFNTGSDVPTIAGGDTERVVPVKPIVNLYRARQWLVRAARNAQLRLFVLGGGAAGIHVK